MTDSDEELGGPMDLDRITRKVCRHCGWRSANEPRGLCRTCYQNGAIRCRYDSLAPCNKRRCGNRGMNSNQGSKLTLPQPTGALPGSSEKVEELARRVEAREQLWHPQDGSV